MPCFPPCRFLEAHSESQGEESTSTAARLLRLAIDNMKVGMARWLCLLVCLCLSDTIGCAAQITVTNVHIRYEDSTSHPATPFAVGLTMDRFAVSTTNERGEAVFVNRVDAGSHGSPSTALLHKAASITDLGLYAAWRWLRLCCAGALLLLPSCVCLQVLGPDAKGRGIPSPRRPCPARSIHGWHRRGTCFSSFIHSVPHIYVRLPMPHCDATWVAEHDTFVLVPDMPWRL